MDATPVAELAAAVDREFGGLDFLVHGAAFAPKAELDNPFVQTSREGFRIALDVSAYSLIGLTHAVVPLMERRGGGSIVTLTYLGSQRVFTNYNVMGVAKAALEASVRYLASDLGPKNIRVNAISAGAIKTLAASGISGFSSILQVYRDKAPLRRGVDQSEVADAARKLGHEPPSYKVVRSVVGELEPALVTLAHEGSKAYSDSFDLVHRREADAPNAIWQADHTELDILIKDTDGTARRCRIAAVWTRQSTLL